MGRGRDLYAGVSNPHRKVDGYSGKKERRYERSSGVSHFNTEEDGKRAIKRAKRWLAHKSTGPDHIPPRHIYRNAELAAFQFKGIEKSV